MNFQNVLCPVDYSDASMAALRKATDLTQQGDGVLHILHVYELLFVDGYVDGMAPIPISPDVDALRKQLLEIRPEGVQLAHELIFGVPASSILSYAKTHDIDLIVMGTHSKHTLERWLLGSVTESVMRSAPCPVLMVHNESSVPHPEPSLTTS